MNVKVIAAVLGAGMSFELAIAKDMQAIKVPEQLMENGFVLDVEFAAERNEYMSPSTSITKVRGFRDKKACWDHAAAIVRAIESATKEAKNKGSMSFSCNKEVDFRKK